MPLRHKWEWPYVTLNIELFINIDTKNISILTSTKPLLYNGQKELDKHIRRRRKTTNIIKYNVTDKIQTLLQHLFIL